MKEKERSIEQLMGMRESEVEVVKGLKDIIATLTDTLRDKEASHKELQDKYVLF